MELVSGFKYKLILENEEIFTPCINKLPNVVDLPELFDISEFHTKEDGDELTVSGNMTSKWNYEPTDRIDGFVTLYRYERREWVATLYSMTVKDVCSVIYDDKQYWYELWTKHIISSKNVRENCLMSGAKFIYEPFVVDIHIDIKAVVPLGRNKFVIYLKAFDKDLNVRDPMLCLEIIGDVIRL
ncbi:uncharacterized protein LOC132798731 [Drosophila nasuta]|uniref:uncharacterized protein LOC132798731 n=1 Tax=Drosophila nasuta TaxID=42062 RepID=UPI00295EF6CD|nr:uncharacterized protein LOC132798731 [Drosophila nasuta]